MRFFTGAILAALLAPLTDGRTVDFARDIHPLLEARCAACHRGNGAQAGLKLESRDDVLRGGQKGPAIIPGKAEESLLVRKLEGHAGLRMPPSGPPLTPDVIALVREWIDQGAVWPKTGAPSDRLAPVAPRTPAVPEGAGQPVDRFIAFYLRSKQIATPDHVSDAVFARRAYFDLWGLPPSPEELSRFASDRNPGKRATLVDRLLADRTKYADHWMSFWNDLLRNDEGVIYHGERKSITDWLLDALRTNQPYDRMVQALLNPKAKTDPEGFLTGVTWRGVVSASQSPPMQASQNSAQVFLGMNLKCAACHDSFVNRWKLRDTYGLAAMFSTDRLEMVRCDIPTGKTAEPGFPLPDVKVSFGDSQESRREAAARWFTTPENGRFARTLVNRYWKQLFGRGLVEPVDDMDAEPWNRDLLDWLASDFAGHGYDLQHLLRRLMISAAYQMPSLAEKDQPREYVFRGPQLRRLSAEQFEDTISAVSGDWRVSVPRADTHARYVREWRLKSDPLSRALGRPIRDQVTTERNALPSTLQALEMTNGPLLSERIERAALALAGELPEAPANRFDSKLLRAGAAAVDIDISGAAGLWLVISDEDSYDPARVIAGWTDAELTGPGGTVKLADLPAPPNVRAERFELQEGPAPGLAAPVPSVISWKFPNRKFTRFRARAVIDERSRKSDIGPALRFFVFTEKPEEDRLVRIEGALPAAAPARETDPAKLVDRLYLALVARPPSPGERQLALAMMGGGKAVSAAGLEDLLWAVLMSPEFQYIR